MASRVLNVTITGDAKSLNRALGSVDSQTGKVESRLTKFSTATKAALAGAAVGGAALLVKGLSDSIHAAADAEKSQARLQTQLRASGIAYRDHAREIENTIQKTSRLAGLDDEDLQDAFTNIVRASGNVSQSLKLTGLAADIARAKHIDVAKAGQLLGRVVDGNVNALGRYGVSVTKGASVTQALGQIQAKFSGQAAAYGRTSAGAQDRFRVATENLQEAIGKKLLPVVTRITVALSKFTEQMTDGTGAGGRFAKRMHDTAQALGPLFSAIGKVAGALTNVVEWFSRAAANVSLFVEDVRDGTRQTGSFGAKLHAVGVTIVNLEKTFAKISLAIVNGITLPFRAAAAALGSVVEKIQWLIDHIPKIPSPGKAISGLIGKISVAPNTGIKGNPNAQLPDDINAALAVAELSPDSGDDLAALGRAQNFWQTALRVAQARGSNAAIANAASNLKGINDQIASLTTPTSSDTLPTSDTTTLPEIDPSRQADIDSRNANTQALQQLADELAKSNAHAGAVSRVSLDAAWKALADLVSGQISGYNGYMGRAQTAGAGSTFRL